MASDTLALLKDGTAEIVPAGGLEEKLALGRPLRVKLGVDPTAADVTLGWAVVLRKLRQFQDAGHIAVLIVGDFTARVGDPSGKSETRPRLTKEVVQAFVDRLLDQFGLILTKERLEVRHNSEWLDALVMEDILRLTSAYTVAQMLEREDFAKRFAEGRPISIMEFLYPLFQGFDSVAVEADIELGGNDQLFNNLVGRDMQRDRGQDPQVVMTVPLLEGLDGVQKMSQSLGNYVGIREHPDEMFGKLMSLPDPLIGKYLRLCTGVDRAEVDAIDQGLADGSLHAGEQKRRLAREVVDIYHGAGAGAVSERHFDVVFKDHGLPDQLPEAQLPSAAFVDGRTILPRLLTELGLATSHSDGRRKVEGFAVRLDQEQKSDPWEEFTPEDLAGKILQVGKRRHLRLLP